jgi:hypothetical protein
VDITLLSFALAALAALTSIIALRRLSQIQQTNRSLVEDLLSLQRRLRENEEHSEQQMARLTYEVKRQSGQLRFTPEMTVARAYDLDARAQSVLASFHLGGCSHCAVDESLSLAEAAESQGRDLTDILVALNTLPDEPAPETFAGLRLDPELRVVS